MPARSSTALLLLIAISHAPAQDSPLDKLDPKLIPAEERLPWQPKELVAVLGSHRGRHWASVRALAYSPDGKLLASAGGDDVVCLWDAATLRELAAMSVKKLSRYPQLAFAPDSKTLYAPGHAWDVSGAEPKPRDKGPFGPALFSRDGKRMAAFGEDGMKVYDWSSDGVKEAVDIPIKFNIKFRLVYEPVGFSRDGRFLAIRRINSETGYPMDVQLWEIDAAKSTAKKREDLFADKKMTSLVAMSPDGRWLAITDMGGQKFTARLHDLTDKNLKDIAIEPGPQPPSKRKTTVIRCTGVGFSQDSKYLLLGTTNYNGGYTWIVEITKDGKAVHRGRLPDIEDEQIAFASSPDGKTLASGGAGHVIRLWQWPAKDVTEKEIHRVHPEGIVYEAGPIAWLRDGQTLVSGGADKKVRLWDVSKAPFAAKELPDWKERVFGVAVAAEGKHLAVAGATGTASYRKTADGWGDKRWLPHDGNPHMGMAIAPDGAWVAIGGHFYTGSKDGVRFESNREKDILMWDLKAETPKRITTIPDTSTVAATPDGKLLATGHDQRKINVPPAVVWTLKDGVVQKRGRELGYDGPRYPIAISPDGKRLASYEPQLTSSTGKFKTCVSLWNIDGFKAERLADMEDEKEKDARYLLPDASFSPDGKLLAAISYSDKVIVLDTRGGRERHSWQLPRSFRRRRSAAAPCVATSPSPPTGDIWRSVTPTGRFTSCGCVERRRTRGIRKASSRGLAEMYHPVAWQNLAAAGHNCAAVWKLGDKGWSERRWLPYDGNPYGLAFAADGRSLLIGGFLYKPPKKKGEKNYDRETTYNLWSLSGQLPRRTETSGETKFIAATPDGSLVVTGDGAVSSAQLLTLDGVDIKLKKQLQGAKRFESPRGPVALSPNGKYMVTHDHNNSNYGSSLWRIEPDVERLAMINYPREEHRYRHTVAAFSPDGKLAAISPYKDFIILLDAESGKELNKWEMPHSMTNPDAQSVSHLRQRGLAFAPDGKHLAVSNVNGTIYVLRVR